VFYHNLHDILSLATLAVHIDRVLSDPFAAAHSIDLYCAGRIFERAGDIDLASQCYEEALARGIQGTERQDSLVRLSITFKRTRRWDRAMRVWEQLVDDGGESAIVGLVEMSKYYEHVEAEYLSALDAVQGAIVLRELNPAPQADIGLVDLEHRRGRLLSKVYRERSWVEGGRERRRRGKRER
jgi:tetratricopeptide (TPR) repeat protein